MPTQRLVTINAWSYSRYGTYTQCPFKAKCQYIDKLKEPDSKAGEEGTRIHALAAAITLGRVPTLERETERYRAELAAAVKAKKLPPELETFADEFRALKKAKAICEENWCFDKDWNPTDWFAKDAWLRAKVDCHWLEVKKNGNGLRATTVHIIDHKSGKENEDHQLQRSLYGLTALLRYPDAVAVTAEHWYLQPGRVGGPDTFKRADLEELKKEWLNRTTAMLNDTNFAPRPGEYCRWCAFSRAKQGPCKF